MKPESILDALAHDVLGEEDLKILEGFYKLKLWGAAESWFLKKLYPRINEFITKWE